MNSRERVNTALEHKQPDMVPISMGAHICDSFTRFSKDVYEKYLGHETTPHFITHKAMGTVSTPEYIMNMFEMDFRTIRLKAPDVDSTITYEDGSYLDEFGLVWKPCEYYYDMVVRPLTGEITVNDIEKTIRFDPHATGRAAGIAREAKNLYKNTDFAVVTDLMCAGPFEQSLWLRGWEDFFYDIYKEPKLAEALLNKITEIDIALYDVLLSETGDYVDIVCQGDDLGMQDRSIIPLEIYDKYIKKYHKRIFDFIKSKTRAKIFLHTCGSVSELIPGLIEAGVDILNPVQTSAKNMNPENLKKEFGKDICFWGAIDVQRLLPFGTPQQIEDEIKKLIEVLGKDGGYILSPAHNIQALVPGQNIDAMRKAMIKYRNF